MPRSKLTLSRIELPIARRTRSQKKELISAFENLDTEHAYDLIFEKGVDLSVLSPQLLTRSLWQAVKMQNAQLVDELLKYRPKLKTDKEPMLLLAVKQLNLEIAWMLIGAGADLKETHYLHVIASCPDPKMHELAVALMKCGLDIQARDCYNRSVLYYAVENGALSIAEELFHRDFRISDEENILTMAAKSLKAPELLALFVKYRCISIDARNKLALTAIFDFIQNKPEHVAAIKMLLDQGVPVDQTNGYGITALHQAVRSNRIEIVKLLLEYGANVNQRSYSGTTPLLLAAELCEASIAVLLIKRGANIHDCANNGEYPIHVACDFGRAPIIHLLISLGAKVDVINGWDLTPLSCSQNEGTDILIKHFALLTTNGVTIEGTDLVNIKNDETMATVYDTCLKELQTMKDTNFMDGVTYFDLVNGKIEKLSILTKNSEFVEQFYKNQKNAYGQSFQWLKYSREITVAFQMAEKRRDLLISKEVLLQNAFKDALPQIILEKIARYLVLDELIIFKKNFYLSLFST